MNARLELDEHGYLLPVAGSAGDATACESRRRHLHDLLRLQHELVKLQGWIVAARHPGVDPDACGRADRHEAAGGAVASVQSMTR